MEEDGLLLCLFVFLMSTASTGLEATLPKVVKEGYKKKTSKNNNTDNIIKKV